MDRRPLWALGAVSVVLLAGAAAYFNFSELGGSESPPEEVPPSRHSLDLPVSVAPDPSIELLAVGSTFEWSAATSPDEVSRRVGPYTIRITKKTDGEMVAPMIQVSAHGTSVEMEGETTSSTFSHSLSAVQNRKGAAPVVMLQSFSGGAHCCNEVQLAGLVKGRMALVSLGSWDGDNIGNPKDISGDGLTDYVFSDNSFLYAFAAYAMSYAPPQIFNVSAGKAVDVSSRYAFRSLHLKSMALAGEACRTGEDGKVRNGACPAYVASAARVGKLTEAWRNMLASYDAAQDWEYPTGCVTPRKDACPSNEILSFKSYPEALLFFLKEQGYVAKSWQPPEMRNNNASNPAALIPESDT